MSVLQRHAYACWKWGRRYPNVFPNALKQSTELYRQDRIERGIEEELSVVDNRFDALLHVTDITKDLATAQDEYVKACAELKATREYGFDLNGSYRDYQRLLKNVTEKHNAVGALETKLINTVFEFSLFLRRD